MFVKGRSREITGESSLEWKDAIVEVPAPLCLLVISFAAFAQDTPKASKPKSHVRTMTGCLSQGDSPDEFTLITKNGSTWEMRSGEVPLAKHLGHPVTVTGVASHAKRHDLKEDAKEAATDNRNQEE